MNTIKVSVTFRSTSVVWIYKATKKRDIWEDLQKLLETKFNANGVKHNTEDGYCHYFEIQADSSPDQVKSTVETLLMEILNEEQLKSVTVSAVSLANPASASVGSSFDEKFQAFFSGNSEKKETDEPPSEEPKPSVKSPAEKSHTDKEAVVLSERAVKLKTMKDTILSKVKGQQHAVDEFVQTIFEAELFSAYDDTRVKPLATFLFCGPSGVGKTFLAQQCKEHLDREVLIVDMSDFSNNLSNGKFNGDHGDPNIVTGFVRKHPNGVIVFDEIEKAHINTIHLFLQILDQGVLMDHKINKNVSFRDNIIVMTTNVGKSLYDDPTVTDLSNTPRNVILKALGEDKDPYTKESLFPECIITRMASGHVILFNHLEPYALLDIVSNEISKQLDLFKKSTGISVNCDIKKLSAFVLYNGGGVADARSLTGLARNVIVRELQELIMQAHHKLDADVDRVKNVNIRFNIRDDEALALFENCNGMRVTVLSEVFENDIKPHITDANMSFDIACDEVTFKRSAHSMTEYILIDPLFGCAEQAEIPNDIEDFDSIGMKMFDYVREYCSDTPVYILDSSHGVINSFDTLISRGARGVISCDMSREELDAVLQRLSFETLFNNNAFSLGRSGKFLAYNCSHYINSSDDVALVFDHVRLKKAVNSDDAEVIAKKGQNVDINFDAVVGCKAAKEALMEFTEMLSDPRKVALQGKTMPKGVLLYGPPGTGKTLLAKAMANECEAAFFPTTATSFFAPLVGSTEQNIRELFAKARRNAPSIIFIDEVDAIGKRRTGDIGSHHNEDALTTFLSQMDGFVTDPKRPVFILAATNYDVKGDGPNVLDAAFVRRFDRKIYVDLPDTDDRYKLLLMSLEKHGIHFGEDHEKIVRNMAVRTGGMSNADLEMMNLQYARSLKNKEPDQTSYMEAVDEFRYGEVRKIDPAELRQTACHEAGHALVCRLCGITPSFLTVVSRGNFGGFMESASENKRGTQTFDELMDIVCRCLAGRVAEIVVYGEKAGINTGASSDIAKARYIIRAALEDYAMGEHLFTRWKSSEAEELMRKQYDRTRDMIVSNRQTLDDLTDLLAEKKSLDNTQLERFFTAHKV